MSPKGATWTFVGILILATLMTLAEQPDAPRIIVGGLMMVVWQSLIMPALPWVVGAAAIYVAWLWWRNRPPPRRQPARRQKRWE